MVRGQFRNAGLLEKSSRGLFFEQLQLSRIDPSSKPTVNLHNAACRTVIHPTRGRDGRLDQRMSTKELHVLDHAAIEGLPLRLLGLPVKGHKGHRLGPLRRAFQEGPVLHARVVVAYRFADKVVTAM